MRIIRVLEIESHRGFFSFRVALKASIWATVMDSTEGSE